MSKTITQKRVSAMQQVVLVLLLAGLSLLARADTQYWLAIGSFSSEENALRQQRAAQSIGDMSVMTASTSQGLMYRVVQGPFSQREAAESELVVAIAAGFEDAWLLARNDGDDLASTSYSSFTTSEAELPDYVPSYASTDTESVYGLDPNRFASVDAYAADDSAGSDFATARSEREPGTRLVTEAPPGFNLHRLIRSVARPPSTTND